MRCRLEKWNGCVVLLAGVLAGPTSVHAADDFKVEEGYTLLFNGKDLTGWRYGKDELEGKAETADKRFQVMDGVIVAAPGKGIKDLYTLKSFDNDFQLKLEFRASAKSDSGVYIRGPQLQVRDFIRRGEQQQLTKFKNDDWNELDITVKNNVFAATLNGETLDMGRRIPAQGPIGLQAETGKFEFRRIRLKATP